MSIGSDYCFQTYQLSPVLALTYKVRSNACDVHYQSGQISKLHSDRQMCGESLYCNCAVLPRETKVHAEARFESHTSEELRRLGTFRGFFLLAVG